MKKLMLLTALCAIISCGGGGGTSATNGGTSASNGPTPSTPINPENPSAPGVSSHPIVAKIAAPKLSETNLAMLKIGKNVDYSVIKEDTKDGYPESFTSPITAISSYYEVKKNEIGIRVLSRELKIGVPTIMDVRTGGVAIVYDYDSSPYFNFVKSDVRSLMRAIKQINNLTLNMEPDSYLFMFTDAVVKLSETNLGNIMSETPISLRPTINGTDYKMFKFHESYIMIDQDVNLDDPNDLYNQLVVTNSRIDIKPDVTILGTNDNQIGVQLIYNRNKYWNTNHNTNFGNIDLKGNNSIGAYVQATRFQNKGTISVGKNSTGIYMLPEKGNDIDNEMDYNFGAENLSVKNDSEGTITLGENSTGMYIYKPWVDIPAVIINHGAIKSTANNAIGMFANVRNQKSDPLGTDALQTVLGNASGTWFSDGKGIELKGDKSIGMYSTGDAKYQVMNYRSGKIVMGDSTDRSNPSIGIYNDNPNVTISNYGVIEIGKNSVGIASLGGTVVNYSSDSSLILSQDGAINITGDGGIGMYLENGAKGINDGTITTVGSPKNAIGVFVGNDSEFTNNGSIIINSEGGAAIVVAGGTVKNYGDIEVSGGAVRERIQTPTVVTRAFSNSVMPIKKDMRVYVDSLGKTNPINGLTNLGLKNAELSIGAEATEKTNATEVTVGKDVIDPFNKSIKESNIESWSVDSGSLVWEAEPEIKDNNIEKVTLKKQSYAKYADEKTEEVAKALDEKYVNTGADTKDKQIFNDMNRLRTEKELAKTYKEVSGGQYINVQQRINQTDEVLERELTSLKNNSIEEAGHHISTFAGKDNYEAKTPEIAKSKSINYGAAYLYNDTNNEWGAYAGAAVNKFKLEDEGKSKENVTFVKVGAYKIFNLGIVDWTLSGEGNISWNEMKRRYVSLGTVYENKADYNSYGFAVKNELSKTYQLNDMFTFKPYGALKIGFGKFTDIKEKNSTLGLEIKGNDYYSFKPMAGIELGLSVPVGTAAKFKAGLGLGYEHELGKIENNENEAKFINAANSWKLKGVKGEDKGGLKSELKAGFETGNYNIYLTGGYNTKEKNSHVGIKFGVSF